MLYSVMREASITLPDELNNRLEDYLNALDDPMSLTSIVQIALTEYLNNYELQLRSYRPPTAKLHFPVLAEIDDTGEPDVSINHDAYA